MANGGWKTTGISRRKLHLFVGIAAVAVLGAFALEILNTKSDSSRARRSAADRVLYSIDPSIEYEPRSINDSGGFTTVIGTATWPPDASLTEIGAAFNHIGFHLVEELDRWLASGDMSDDQRVKSLIAKARLFNYEAEPRRAYDVLEQVREFIAPRSRLAARFLYGIIYYQGVTALRCGETENCIMCRGESSCIVPISKAAQHTKPDGSQRAIKHFTEYLKRFPEDFDVRWLLNLAHMTLGEHPQGVDSQFLISLDYFTQCEFDIGRFRDIGAIVGVNRFNQSGGAIMDDFDNDGLLDLVVTAIDPTMPTAIYRNTGDGTFVDRSEVAGVTAQLGGLNCMQTDYDNDGFLDICIVRGAWFSAERSIRPSLLRNNGDGTFGDVTEDAGLLHPMNSIAAAWADYDNDGAVDLLICGERQPSRLYRNRQIGTFSEAGLTAGIVQNGDVDCKGAAWLDYDNDGFQDLYLNFFRLEEGGKLFHNTRDGRFADVSRLLGGPGPRTGFSCWAWDYNNDGWLDLFASSSDWTMTDIVQGMIGLPCHQDHSRLFANRHGRGFEDVAAKTGIGQAFAQMGSNFGDFDNDGYLDVYLGTGGPELQSLVPNRMLKNVEGERFADITASARTGNLQKGHGVACGDWDRDGQVDVFIEMGGPTHGDKYHNILFQNPGHDGHHWLTLKLVGERTNRAAFGARVKIVTAGSPSQTIYRHISSGSSFGANPLEQTIGIGKAEEIAVLEITWPASGLTQTFRDVPVDQSIVVTESRDNWRRIATTRVPLPDVR